MAVTDRRPPQRGDKRRSSLLRALDELLKQQPLDDINVAEITTGAGVTRSAFYFYFADKAACAAALSDELYREAVEVTRRLVAGPGTPEQRIDRAIRAVFAIWQGHPHHFQATLAARRRSPAVRELWDTYRTSLVDPVAEMIDAERAAGTAPPGPDSRALATVLLELNDHSLELLGPGDPVGTEQRIEVLVAMWLRTIYGSSP